ncbi:iron-containing alcohol dehydrogenase [Chloroflexota bacterium]
MEEPKQVSGNDWLSRIDEYPQFPRLRFGVGALSKLGELAKEIATNTDSIIITDAALEKIGLIESPKKFLEDAGFTVDVYKSEVKEPILEDVKKVIDVVKGKNYGLVVGIGGGAVMDRAKTAAVMSETQGELEEYLCPNVKPLVASKPKLLITTTSGTGSECSSFAVVIAPKKHVGLVKTWIADDPVLADVAIIDPSLTLGLPPRVTAGTGMDAMSHTAEAVLSLQANAFSDALSLKAVELVSQNLRTAYSQGKNIESRCNMALASTIGGMVISCPWVAGPAILAHVASEGISARYNIPHGEACGVLLPFTYWYNLTEAYGKRKLAKIAEAMGEDIHGLSTEEAARRAITATFNLLQDINLPTSLKDYNIPIEDIPAISEYILQRAEEMYSMSQYNPKKATLENVKEFFSKALAGRESIGF